MARTKPSTHHPNPSTQEMGMQLHVLRGVCAPQVISNTSLHLDELLTLTKRLPPFVYSILRFPRGTSKISHSHNCLVGFRTEIINSLYPCSEIQSAIINHSLSFCYLTSNSKEQNDDTTQYYYKHPHATPFTMKKVRTNSAVPPI